MALIHMDGWQVSVCVCVSPLWSLPLLLITNIFVGKPVLYNANTSVSSLSASLPLFLHLLLFLSFYLCRTHFVQEPLLGFLNFLSSARSFSLSEPVSVFRGNEALIVQTIFLEYSHRPSLYPSFPLSY